MGKYSVIIVKKVDFADPHPGQSIANRDPRSRLFTLRNDVAPHMHKPGDYYCGRCMFQVHI